MAKKKTGKNYNHHMLVPKHEKLSEKQKKEILKEHNCSVNQLPRIFSTDPAIRDEKPNVGDIYKIHRYSRTEGISIFYRVIVDE